MVRTRRQYKSGEASPPPHCLANASTTEQHNDYMLKFRAELAERRAAALAKEQEALGASDVDKFYEGVRRSQVDVGLRTWATNNNNEKYQIFIYQRKQLHYQPAEATWKSRLR